MNNTDKIKRILNEELNDYALVDEIGKATGVKGDIGLYGSVIVINLPISSLRSINWRKLKKIQSRITNELPNVSRVLIEI